MPSTTLQNGKKTSILLRVPVSFKKNLQSIAKKGKISKYIIDVVGNSMKKERLRLWFEEYLKSDRVLRVKKVSRNWPTDRLYNPKKK